MTDPYENDVEDRRAAADSRLWMALMEHADAYHLSSDGEILDQFAIVCHWSPEERDGRSRYTTHFHSPEVPDHIAVGLFHVGVRVCDADGFREDHP